MPQDGRTALMIASDFGYLGVCDLLLRRGADVSIRDNVCDMLHFVCCINCNNILIEWSHCGRSCQKYEN